MLGLALKGLPYTSRRLDHGPRENKTASYLALNPKGQLPTVVAGDYIIRKSIAILAWLDRAYPNRPIWGETPQAIAQFWQDVMLLESDLRPHVTETARSLLRQRPLDRDAINALCRGIDDFDARLGREPYLGGSVPMASDIWLYPALHWITRGVALSPNAPSAGAALVSGRSSLDAWMTRFAALQEVDATYAPHWRDGSALFPPRTRET